MVRGARPATALAAGLMLVGAAAPAAVARPAEHTAGVTRPGSTAGVTRPGSTAGVPRPGSSAARLIGGPLMASRGTVVEEPADDRRPLPRIPASAWVIANASTGQVLAARDPHGEFGPASTLKVLTAITLIPLLNPDGSVAASSLATSQQPTSAGLVTGRAYRIADLFRALLLISANDAAVALTQATGSFAGGMALINAEARHLQAYDVVAKLPNGLPAAGQVTSAYDEALIARQALAVPAFMHYDSTRAARFEVRPHDWETLVNQNTLLTSYRGGIGGKIGWTISSQATYIGLARRNGVTLIVTVLHCTPLQEITAAEKLLNWGFAMNGKVRPAGLLVPPLTTDRAVAHPPAQRATQMAMSAARPGRSNQAPYWLAIAGLLVAAAGVGALAATRRSARPAPGPAAGGPPASHAAGGPPAGQAGPAPGAGRAGP